MSDFGSLVQTRGVFNVTILEESGGVRCMLQEVLMKFIFKLLFVFDICQEEITDLTQLILKVSIDHIMVDWVLGSL